jgi:hypothetical protein
MERFKMGYRRNGMYWSTLLIYKGGTVVYDTQDLGNGFLGMRAWVSGYLLELSDGIIQNANT